MNEKINLSNRLRQIASFLTPGSYFADIGSDHGYLPCFVCLKDPFARAIASEVREGPYKRTIETVKHYDLEAKITVRLGNGLEALHHTDSVEEIIISGMGGTLIAQIIEEGKDKLENITKIIVQPNNNAIKLRKLFLLINYTLTKEIILQENNHYYEILVAEKHNNSNPYKKDEMEKQLFFGPLLLEEKSFIFKQRWKEEKEKLIKIVKQMKNSSVINQDKLQLFQQQLEWMEEVL